MKTILYHDTFDPATPSQIRKALAFLRKKKARQVVFVVENRQAESFPARLRYLKHLIHPYRHLKLHYSRQDEIVEEYFEPADNAEAQRIREGNFDHLDSHYRQLLMKDGLYFVPMIQKACKPKRFAHSLSVAQTAQTLALAHGLDGLKAYRMGLLHDLAKNMEEGEAQRLISLHQPYEAGYPKEVWHQYNGYDRLKRYYHLNDKTTLKAIRHHCLGDCFEPYASLLYIADKIEPTRGYDCSETLRIALSNLKEGHQTVLEESRAYREKEKQR